MKRRKQGCRLKTVRLLATYRLTVQPMDLRILYLIMHITPFQPPAYLKPAAVQTMLASLKIRTWGKKNLLHRERQMVLETQKGV